MSGRKGKGKRAKEVLEGVKYHQIPYKPDQTPFKLDQTPFKPDRVPLKPN